MGQPSLPFRSNDDGLPAIQVENFNLRVRQPAARVISRLSSGVSETFSVRSPGCSTKVVFLTADEPFRPFSNRLHHPKFFRQGGLFGEDELRAIGRQGRRRPLSVTFRGTPPKTDICHKPGGFCGLSTHDTNRQVNTIRKPTFHNRVNTGRQRHGMRFSTLHLAHIEPSRIAVGQERAIG